MALECGEHDVRGRNYVRAQLNDPDGVANQYAGDELTLEVSTTGAAGPWTPAFIADDFSGNDCVGTQGVVSGGGATAGLAALADIVALTTGTTYHFRWTHTASPIQGNPTGEVLVCGPFTMQAFPTTFCLAPTGVEETEATVRFPPTTGGFNAWQTCNRDTVIWETATTAGGPYTALPSEDISGLLPTRTLTGLTPDTEYFYRARFSHPANADGPAAEFLVTPECSFTTDAPPNEAPVITGTDDQTGPVGTELSDTFQVNDPNHADSVLTITSAPAGAVIDHADGTNDWTIRYTPTAPGPVTFTITATDPDGATSTDTITFNGTAVTTPDPPVLIPQPCDDGGGDPPLDVENVVLCDKMPDGSIAGTAVLVYTYDEAGVPTGPPTAVIPGTNDPYVAQGVLSPCEQCQATEPQTFFFTSSTTGPTDFPGRSYSGDLSISRGYAIDQLIIGGTVYPVSLRWNILDTEGTEFAAALEAAIQGRIPGSDVTVTPPPVNRCATEPQPFSISIACIDQDRAPNDVSFRYDGGADLVQNAAFLDGNGDPVVPPGGLAFTTRQDNGGTVGCTSVAGEGWQTNDPLGQFESWGAGFLGTTPTPRGTGIQEINANGQNTLWQVVDVTTAGVFTVEAFVGGRGTTEQWNLRLSTGNTGPGGPGDRVNIVQASPPVGDTPNPQPWTRISQTGIALAPGIYTVSLVGPPSNSIGGLFADLRLFTSSPDQIQALTPDDTCVNTRDVTTNTVVCELWQPRDDGNCETVAWRNIETGETLADAAFWAQTPAPVGCYIAPEGEAPEVTFGNLIHTYTICANGTSLQRTIITDNSGAPISEQFADANGSVVGAPTSYTIGACPGQSAQVESTLVCADGQPAIRRVVYRNGFQQSEEFLGANGAVLAAPTTWIAGACTGSGVDDECQQDDNGIFYRRTTANEDGTVTVSTVDVAGNPYTPVGAVTSCSALGVDVETTLLCDTQPNGVAVPFLTVTVYSSEDGSFVSERFVGTDGSPYTPTGFVGNCTDPAIGWESVCYTTTAGGTEVFPGTKRHDDRFPPPGFQVFDQDGQRVDDQPGYEQVVCSPDCCPQPLGSGCYDDNGDTRRWQSYRLPDGSVEIIDTITGDPVDSASIVPCSTAEQQGTRLVTLNANETFVIPTVGLVSWSVRAITAPVAVTIGGDPAMNLVVGEVVSSSATGDRTLADSVSVNVPGAGLAHIAYEQNL